jgi:predicted transcriptional regulator
LIWSILQSKVGMSILMKLKIGERTYQQDLIQETSYSNKSIIEYLKRMVSANMLEQGMEQVSTGSRRVWIKWYTPTRLGRWLILFVSPPEEIPDKLARRTVEELFQVYSSGILEVCERYGIDIEFFHHVLTKEKEKAAKKEENVTAALSRSSHRI